VPDSDNLLVLLFKDGSKVELPPSSLRHSRRTPRELTPKAALADPHEVVRLLAVRREGTPEEAEAATKALQELLNE
jgi:hypothetical protein